MLMRRNVLILHTGALGDFVVTWPLAMAMGRMFPQSRIIYIAAHEKGKLAERAIRVESGDIEAGWHRLFAESPAVPESVGRLLTGAHTVFNFASQPGDAFSRNLLSLAPEAKYFTMTTRPTNAPPATDGHVSQWLVNDLATFPAAAESVRQMLRSVADRGLGTHRPMGDTIVLHPGSGADRKNWPIDRFIELANSLTQNGRTVHTVLGEVELERWPAEQIARIESVSRLVKPANYLALYEDLIHAAGFVGNDSGPGHLAGIIGVPTVSLFGGADAATWKPLGPSVAVVQRPTLNEIEPSFVLETLNTLMAKTPAAKQPFAIDASD